VLLKQESVSKTEHLVMPKDHMDQLYNSRNPLVKFVHRQRLDAIAALVPTGGGLKVLDAGCGEGHLIQRLHESCVSSLYYGVDLTSVALERSYNQKVWK
jgi:2-polyprenyl-3-methyl-5-hydroxy-6-metoxy-1,4-benzoquinol methylase